MELTYSITREDYWAFNKFYLEKYRHFRRTLAINSIVVAGACGLVMGPVLHLPTAYVLVWCCIVVAVCPAFLYWQCKQRVMRLPAKGGTMLGEHNLRMDSESVSGISLMSEGSIRWSGVLDIVETKEHFFMFVDTAMAFIVPKRVFKSSADAVQFLNAAKSFWKAAKA
ncbi:MAG TPA: YcxB family protein [Terriglobia bacterium]|nr:YcxB family protein [Terriglobia bacterium]